MVRPACESILIRADGDAHIGTGHIMRCLSLTEALRRTGAQVRFACAACSEALEKRILASGATLTRLAVVPGSEADAPETCRLARQLPGRNPWVVADGYGFDADYQRAVKDAGFRLLLLDDFGHADHYYADYVLNQNLSARLDWYKRCEPETRLLLGPRYALLRPQFAAYRDWSREIPPVARKVLITMGGADPDNVTAKVVTALDDLDVDAKVVVGGANRHYTADAGCLRMGLTFERDVSNMPELMAWADIAIAAGGTTSWELAFMGVPSLLCVLADNQREIAAALDRAGVCRNLGEHATISERHMHAEMEALLSDSDRRRSMSEKGRELVDGAGAERVADALQVAGMVEA